MASIEKVKGSNGSGNANLATVQNIRNPLASTIIVDTVLDINPAGFIGTMGAPHTFTDPITSEVITVISQATAVDFAGHVNSGHIEIDTIAPGYTDLGSKVGDIIVVRPTTQWGDNLAAVLAAAHNDDGSLIPAAVRTALSETTTSDAGWTPLPQTPNTVTPLGNRSYNLTFNGVDLTGVLSNGMRLKTTRTAPAPTQCTSLNGTTQYFSKASPAGFSFTNLFTCMGWVKPTAYGAIQTIVRKGDASNGFCLRINAAGLLDIFGGNAGGFDEWNSYQSVPLNKWTHVAATLDCSGNVANMYIDGVAVPCFQTANSITAIVNSGNLAVGATPLAAEFFAGKLAQVAVFSAVISQATIQSYISQGLAGTETSLVSAYSLSGASGANDLNANANNLTANGSAVTTNADAPWGGQANGTISSTVNYAIITKGTFSTNTILTVQVPEGCTIATSGGILAVSYATVKAPYGMPIQRGKWTIASLNQVEYDQANPVLGTWYNLGSFQISLPVGEWQVRFRPTYGAYKNTSTAAAAAATLSTANNTESNSEFTVFTQNEGASGTTSTYETKFAENSLSVAAATTYYCNIKSSIASSANLALFGSSSINNAPSWIQAECAYL